MIIEATEQTKYLTDQMAKLLDERDRYGKALMAIQKGYTDGLTARQLDRIAGLALLAALQ